MRVSAALVAVVVVAAAPPAVLLRAPQLRTASLDATRLVWLTGAPADCRRTVHVRLLYSGAESATPAGCVRPAGLGRIVAGGPTVAWELRGPGAEAVVGGPDEGPFRVVGLFRGRDRLAGVATDGTNVVYGWSGGIVEVIGEGTRPVPRAGPVSALAVWGGRVAAVGPGRWLEIRWIRDGRLVSRFRLAVAPTALAYSADRVALLAADGTLDVRRARDGRLLCRAAVPGAAALAAAGPRVLVLGPRAAVVVDARSGRATVVGRGSALHAPAIVGRRVAWVDGDAVVSTVAP